MIVTLVPLEGGERFFIRADGEHAGGITLHSICGTCFSYGIAIAPAKRHRGIAKEALSQLFAQMKGCGFDRVLVQIRPDNAASLGLHQSLGFRETERTRDAVMMEHPLK